MGKKRVFLIAACLFLAVILLKSSYAQEENYIVSNSENWRDVYSIIHYANLRGLPSDFLVSTRHGTLLLNGLNKNNELLVISSRSSAFVLGYDEMIKSRGFKGAEERIVGEANLELIKELEDIDNFIIVGDTYGYNAIAVAPYAVKKRAWVFLANRINIDEIESILGARKVNEAIIYGFVGREIKDALARYNPIVIDNGDRFKDNIEIFERYLTLNPAKQTVLTNGEFIEKEVMSGMEPVLFTGKENVPDQIRDYIKSSDIEVGVLIGADLVGAATNIRRSTGISVIVKFARGARAPTGAIAGVEGLDLFYLPTPIMELKISSAKYNGANSQLELTYKSDANIPVYFKGTITPIDASGERKRIGDIEPIFIGPNDYKTISYPLELSEDRLAIDVFTLYGETPSSLEKILEKRVDVELVNVIDKCEINVESIKYSKPKESFIVRVENKGEVDCWADIELNDVIMGGTKKTIGSDGSKKIGEGDSEKIIIKQEMSDEDLEDNPFVNLVAYYGEREDGLVKIFKGKFELGIESISFATIGLVVLAFVVLASIIVLIILLKKKKEQEEW